MSKDNAINDFTDQVKVLKNEMDVLVASVESSRNELCESVLSKTEELKTSVKTIGKHVNVN